MDAELERVGHEIVDAAVKLHMRVGPGFVESLYETLLAKELERRGLPVERQKRIVLTLDGVRSRKAFRIDLLVAGCVLVEVKSASALPRGHWKQVLTYLRILDLRLGFMINFGKPTLKAGLRRVVNGYDGYAR